MLFAVVIIAVAAGFLLRRTPPNEHEAGHGGEADSHGEPTGHDGGYGGDVGPVPAGGGVDLKAVVGVGGSAISLGGTILGALGVTGGGTAAAGAGTAAASGGAVASGGTVAGGTAGAGSGTAGAVTATAGTVDLATSIATQAAFVGYSGVTTGAAALGVTALWFAPFIIATVLAQLAEFAGAQRLVWSELSNNKRRLYFARFYRFEEQMVQRYLDKLKESRSSVAFTKRPVQVIDDVDMGSFNVWNSIVDTVSDAEAQAALPVVRAIARWLIVTQEADYNRSVTNYWASLGDVIQPAEVRGGFFTQVGTNPGMAPNDFWTLAKEYLATQPFAATQPDGWSYQPYGHLAQNTYELLQAKCVEVLGAAPFDAMAAEAHLMGRSRGVALAATKDYQLVWPGDGEFTRAVAVRCGLLSEPGTQKVGPWVIQFIVNAANQWRTVARHTASGDALDICASRQIGLPVIYRAATVQNASWPWP